MLINTGRRNGRCLRSRHGLGASPTQPDDVHGHSGLLDLQTREDVARWLDWSHGIFGA